MGCTQSTIENEESVRRCRARRSYMKNSVKARNAFAAAHSSYAIYIKNIGAAINDFAHAELPSHVIHGSQVPLSSIAGSSSSAAPPPLPNALPHNPLPPPPPPLPNLGSPLQRAVSMPHIKIRKALKPERVSIVEAEEGDDANIDKKLERRSKTGGASNSGRDQPPPTLVQRDDVARPTLAPQDHTSAYEYFFPNVENMPGTTLAETVVVERAASMKESELRKSVEVEEEEEDDEGEEDDEIEVENDGEDDEEDFVIVPETKKLEKKPELPVQVPMVPPMEANEQPPKQPIKGASLVHLFEGLDEHFLRAHESASEVMKMLEATRLHYHSNFADNRGHIDHSARVMRVITWNRSFRGLTNLDDGKYENDDFDSEENETHATVLDKLLAWEKKLYDEVKVGEQMKYDYQKKVDLLDKKKKRGAKPESLEKLKAAVSHLHTRYIVDMQSMDSTVAEINRLRDEQLYPKLSHLVKGMGMMWDAMRMHHEAQAKIAYQLKLVDVSATPVDMTEYHHQRTSQLAAVANEWHAEFCKVIDYQRMYIKALHNWLKLNLIPIESNLKEKVSSPPRIATPPILELVAAWDSFLDACQDEGARSAIKNFAAAVLAINQDQEEEMHQKRRCAKTRQELLKRTQQFEDWYNKFVQTRAPAELDPENAESEPHRAALAQRQSVIEQLKKQLQEEEEDHRRMTVQVRDKSFAMLKTRLPELFTSLSEIAKTFSDVYLKLASVSNSGPRD